MDWILNWALSTWTAGGPWSYAIAAVIIALRLNRGGLDAIKGLVLELKGLIVDDWLGIRTIRGAVVGLARAILDGVLSDDEIDGIVNDIFSTPKRALKIALKIVSLVIPAEMLKQGGKFLLARLPSRQ